MTEAGFVVETTLPFACFPGSPSATASHGNLLLLRVVNMLDIHEPEQDRSQERIEARLDLMLHWLGLQLFGDESIPAEVPVRLEAERIEWGAEGLSPSAEVVLHLYIHPTMAAPLKLAARITGCSQGRAQAELRFDSEAQSEAWTQWLFRRHRRAVHEARSRGGPA